VSIVFDDNLRQISRW